MLKKSPFTKSEHEKIFMDVLAKNSRIVQQIRQFGDEHKIFKGTFTFRDTVSLIYSNDHY